jgi:putative DNA primase/helicase
MVLSHTNITSNDKDLIELKLEKYWRQSKNGKVSFNHVLLAQDIVNQIPFIWVYEELYYYENGVYKRSGRDKVSAIVQSVLGEEYTKARKMEIIDWIETYAKRKDVRVNGDSNIINLKNGIYDIEKKQLIPHSHKYYTTIQIPVKYDKEAQCPKINDFLLSVVPLDSIDFVFEWFGFSLLTEYKFNRALMLYGTGGNGKSIFISLYNKFLGEENVSSVDLYNLEENRFAPSMLLNKLANTFADIDSRFLEKSSMIKSLTGRDRVFAEYKNRMPFSFENFAKLTFSANKLPSFKDTSEGNFRRWMILTFPNKFVEGKNANGSILEEITTEEELSGLLNWALSGLHHLLKNRGFTIGETMQDAINNWQQTTDNVKQFIEDACVVDEKYRVEKKLIYREYQYWCKDNGYKSLNMKNFYDRMEHHGYIAKQSNSKTYGRKHHFLGIDLPPRN